MITVTRQCRNRNAGLYFRDHLSQGDDGVALEKPRAVLGKWFGSGSTMLGLSGAVTEHDFLSVCGNRHPISGRRLRPRDGGIAFFDVTYSAPKSYSILALFDPRLESILETAWENQWARLEVAAQVLDYRGSNRKEPKIIPAHTVVGSVFRHDVNRELEPDQHLHSIVQDFCFCSSRGQWLALDAYPIYQDQKFHNWCIHSQLAEGLINLGHEIIATEDGFEIVGVSKELVSKSSSRRAQVFVDCREILSSRDLLRAKLSRTRAEDQELNRLENLTRRRILNAASVTGRRKKRELEAAELKEIQLSLYTPDEKSSLEELVASTKVVSAKIMASRQQIKRANKCAADALGEHYLRFRSRDRGAELLKENLGSIGVSEWEQAEESEDLAKPNEHWHTTVSSEKAMAVLAAQASNRNHGNPSSEPVVPTDISELEIVAKNVTGNTTNLAIVVVSGGKVRSRLVTACRKLCGEGGRRVVIVFDPRVDVEGLESERSDAVTLAKFLSAECDVRDALVFISETALGGPVRAQRIMERTIACGSSLYVTRTRVKPRTPQLLEELITKYSMRVIDSRRPSSVPMAQFETTDLAGLLENRLAAGAVHNYQKPDLATTAAMHCRRYLQGQSVGSLAADRAICLRLNTAIRDCLRSENRLERDDVPVPALFPALQENQPADHLCAELTQNLKGHYKGERFRVYFYDETQVGLIDENQTQLLVPRHRVILLEQESIQIAGGEWIRATRTARSANGSKILHGCTYRVRTVDLEKGIFLANGVVLRRDHGYIEHAYSFVPGQLRPRVLDSVVACLDGVKNKTQATELLFEAMRIARYDVQLMGPQLGRFFDLPEKTAQIVPAPLPLSPITPPAPPVVESPSEELPMPEPDPDIGFF